MTNTTGPWKAMSQDDSDYPMYVDAGPFDEVAAVAARRSRVETESNARLIAAAPELLEACEWAAIQPHHSRCPVSTFASGECACFVGAAKRAIAKAAGGESRRASTRTLAQEEDDL